MIVDDEGKALVTDFGIARAGVSEITQTGSVMGTAQYLSPEQAQGKEVTAGLRPLLDRGDALRGAHRPRCRSRPTAAVAVAMKQVSQAPQRPSSINPEVSPALDAVVMRALEKQPGHRFQTPTPSSRRSTKPSAARDAAPPGHRRFRRRRSRGRPHRHRAVPTTSGSEREKRGIWKWILLALLVCAVAGAVAYALTRPDSAEVPSVTGQSLSSATAVLKAHGFDTNTTLVPNQAPRDTVLEQDPPPASRLDKGSTITLSVSTGPGTVEIPDVQGLSTKDAKKKLEDAGLEVTSRQEFSDDVAEGLVFGTDPALGTGVATGSTVTMLISKGPNTVAVPGVVGLSQSRRPRGSSRRA